jgi:mannose-1-phosphate guanylyltransferase/MurNAc alpha-1-phosphate uridylyltransferase
VAGVVLAAGAGSRLAPLSERQPKPLCPVANRALLDLAIERVASVTSDVAVNVHHGADAILAHLDRGDVPLPEVHVSLERPEALGTAGALGALRGWIDGRDVLVVNADTWAPGSLATAVSTWDRSRPRVLVHGSARFGPRSAIAGCALAWSEVEGLAAEPSGLYEVVWRRADADGRLDVVRHDGPFVDCGTPADYLRANLEAVALAGGSVIDPGAEVGGPVTGRCVIGAGARVAGPIEDSVVWPGVRLVDDRPLLRSVAAAPDLIVGPLPPES